MLSDGDQREEGIIRKEENSARILKNIGRGPKKSVDHFSNSSSVNILDSNRTGDQSNKRNKRYDDSQDSDELVPKKDID